MKKIFLLLFVFNIVFAGDLDKFKIREFIVLGKQNEKSPALAFGLSLVVPGLGQAYVERFDVGKYFLISEISLWLVYFGMNEYGKWLNDDAVNFAVLHAGVDPTGKDNDFFANIENYKSVYDYNQRKGRDREYDKLYDVNKFYWWWDSDGSRQRYKDIRMKSRAIRYYAKFAVVFVVVNHFASAIDALILSKKSNISIKPELDPSSRGIEFCISLNF